VDKITLLLDSNALTSASCGTVTGCQNLTVTANPTGVARGVHLVELRLDLQSLNHQPTNTLQPYTVSGEVDVLGTSGILQPIPLNKVTPTFQPGTSAQYKINVNP